MRPVRGCVLYSQTRPHPTRALTLDALSLLPVGLEPFFQRSRMQLKEVVIVIVKVKGLALAKDPGTPLADLHAGFLKSRFVQLKLFLRNLESDVVVGPLAQLRTLHNCHPDAADQEKFGARRPGGRLDSDLCQPPA